MTEHGPISFYVPSLTVGGAERVTVTVANGLAARGYDIDLLVPYYEGAFADEVDEAVDIVDLQTPKVPAVGVGASVPRLVSYLRHQSPSMVFAQMLYSSDVCLLAHLLAGSDATVVPTVHNTVGINETAKQRLVQRLAAVTSDRAGQFVAVSQGAAESVVKELGVAPENVSVLHNPIPVADIRAQAVDAADHRWIRSADHEVVLGIGRLAPQKDYATFLEAVRLLHERRPAVRAIIVGRGPERDALETMASDIGVADAVDFAGYVDNPYRYMTGADVLAMSSIHEGLPTVLIEAMACGCPVVSTDCPSGPRTILENGAHGPLVDVGDSRALTDALSSTLRDPPEGAALVDRARDFAPETVLDDYESFVNTHGPVR